MNIMLLKKICDQVSNCSGFGRYEVGRMEENYYDIQSAQIFQYNIWKLNRNCQKYIYSMQQCMNNCLKWLVFLYYRKENNIPLLSMFHVGTMHVFPVRRGGNCAHAVDHKPRPKLET